MYKKHVFVCTSGKTCPLEGSEPICGELRRQIAELGLKKQIRINKTGCLDQCGNGPMIVVYPEGIWYAHVKLDDCTEIVQSHLVGDKPVERLFYDGRGKVTPAKPMAETACSSESASCATSGESGKDSEKK